MDTLDCDPFFTCECAWDDEHQPTTYRFKKQNNSGKRLEEEVIIDTGVYNLEYANVVNIQSFLYAIKTLQYGNGELFT